MLPRSQSWTLEPKMFDETNSDFWLVPWSQELYQFIPLLLSLKEGFSFHSFRFTAQGILFSHAWRYDVLKMPALRPLIEFVQWDSYIHETTTVEDETFKTQQTRAKQAWQDDPTLLMQPALLDRSSLPKRRASSSSAGVDFRSPDILEDEFCIFSTTPNVRHLLAHAIHLDVKSAFTLKMFRVTDEGFLINTSWLRQRYEHSYAQGGSLFLQRQSIDAKDVWKSCRTFRTRHTKTGELATPERFEAYRRAVLEILLDFFPRVLVKLFMCYLF